MKITQEGDDALRVVLFLYEYGIGKRIEAKVIAERINVPLRFLLKLLRKLASAGIVKSARGTGGGYSIERAPETVSLCEVIEAIEGPIRVNRCLLDPDACNLNRAATCPIHRSLSEVQEKLVGSLSDTTFDRLLALQSAHAQGSLPEEK